MRGQRLDGFQQLRRAHGKPERFFGVRHWVNPAPEKDDFSAMAIACAKQVAQNARNFGLRKLLFPENYTAPLGASLGDDGAGLAASNFCRSRSIFTCFSVSS